MRGLKPRTGFGRRAGKGVASFTDAWIETVGSSFWLSRAASHLLQMRGLKLIFFNRNPTQIMSHLLQMRGLKPPTVSNINIGNVASFTDAWIET